MGLKPITTMWAEIVRRVRVFYYRAALAQIWPLHEDVPYIVRRLRELQR